MKDTRDLRDPQAFGEEMAWRRKNLSQKKSFHQIADHVARYSKIPDVPHSDSLGQAQAKLYQEELNERAKRNDKYAIGLLSGYGDDPGGN